MDDHIVRCIEQFDMETLGLSSLYPFWTKSFLKTQMAIFFQVELSASVPNEIYCNFDLQGPL